MKQYLQDLYKRRDLILYLVSSGLKAQHRNTFLGYFWWLLDPLLGVCIYYFVVVILFRRGGEDYGIYLVVGLVVWRWLSVTISAASRSILSQANIISQVYLPKAIFPLGVTITQLVNFGFGLIVIGVFVVFMGILPGPAILWLPYVVLIQLLFSLALAACLAYMCVFIRDIETFLNHLLRLWFFGSPVIWRVDMLPEGARGFLAFNPMMHFLTSYREILIYNRNPDVLALFSIGALSVGVILGALYFYSHSEHQLVKAL